MGGTRERLLARFEEVEEAGRVDDRWTMPYERFTIFVARRPRVPLADAWPDLKHYD